MTDDTAIPIRSLSLPDPSFADPAARPGGLRAAPGRPRIVGTGAVTFGARRPVAIGGDRRSAAGEERRIEHRFPV